ncbi:MAG: ROK family transcriptional regulator [Nitriliruptoraceae bacterium]
MSQQLLGPLRSLGSASSQDARTVNRRSVLHAVASGAAVTRADLARLTGLTRPTISSLVDELSADGLVVELGPGISAGGKRPTLLGIDLAARQVIAIDASVRPFVGILADLSGTEHATAVAADVADPTDALVGLIEELMAQATAPIAGVGIGSPGLVDEDGTVVEAPHLGWSDHPLRARLETATDLPVWVANDANAAALAEFGRLPSERDGLVLVRIGKGIGAGLVLGARPHVGSSAAAGEIGHLVVQPDGLPCACGNAGCLETVASLPAIDRAIAARGGGDDAIEQAVTDAAEHLGAVLAHLVAILDVGDVVLSVERDGYGEAMVARVAAEVRARLLRRVAPNVAVRAAGDPSGLVLDGAHALVLAGALGMVRP